MKIHKVLNNNVAIVRTGNGQDQIVSGRGLAFGKRPGDELDVAAIAQTFTLQTKSTVAYAQLLAEIPYVYLQLTGQILTQAKQAGLSLHSGVALTLADHLATAVQRTQAGDVLPNVMLWDTQRFYPREFAVAEGALALVQAKLNVSLPADEAGFIAFHLVNAATDSTGSDAAVVTRLMQEILSIVRHHFHFEPDPTTPDYGRFITHLKFFAQRLYRNEAMATVDEELLALINQRYQTPASCAQKISHFLNVRYGFTVTPAECGYLTLHIERLVYRKAQ
ncbi:MAG: PRD domain-containing protein [Lactobacillus sp.]|uniref:PRD domain-containing protein n=1 Tax=Lacticaseibacillus suilingensis TaxID=2799577 RepID=UPI0022DF6015|nr:PRD domain-containing protein [Lacticaseibacillus suilingensis]MCI1895203.1 PRD domain-containing protein [Lactobacillus sp.]MCI1917215.1 PRD domain-containing protein [Lactobacillus sp.]MCI1942174.1 PRD domain-containing protein [Lactobacillus sp.]MCI1972616.1 PRD domain-containing protein [Lactobacillus sp.]MCI2017894.1 PRD domain-containing protein [Lactobacillus sp.]